jgi:glycosyltransferase involved in cell wall biosynthesis
MNVIFLTLLDISDINERGIYHDLLRKFRDEGHNVYVIYPVERRKKTRTGLQVLENVSLLKVRTLNIQKTNIIEKGLGTLLLEHQFLEAFKKYFSTIKFDLVLYSTPPITLTRIIQFIKKKDAAISYLLLKDIFPQNAVDLGMIKEGSLLHEFFIKKEKLLYKVSDFIGCMSPANAEYVIKHNPEVDPLKVEVNPNSIAPLAVEVSIADKIALRDKHNLPHDSVIFIYGGNLGKPQGIGFLIEVLESNFNRKDVFFIIVGGGTEYPLLARWYKEKQPSNTLVSSNLPKKEYDELAKAADVGLIFLDKRFTIPNFPSRLLSYLEYKMPVIAATDKNSDVGRIIEEAECGFWVEAGDLEVFNKRLNLMVQTRTLAHELGGNAFQLLRNKYTVDGSYKTVVEKIK